MCCPPSRGANSLLPLPRSCVSVNCSPYYRSPLTKEHTIELMMHRAAHVITLSTPNRLCQFDVTVPYKQLITMEHRELQNKTDLTADYLLPLVSARMKKKDETAESRRIAAEKKSIVKKTALSKMKMIKMLGGASDEMEGKGREGKEKGTSKEEGKEGKEGGKEGKRKKNGKRKGKK